MRNFVPLILLFLLVSMSLYSQVAINNNGAPPDSSAMLDVQSTSRGFVLPRMTFEQRNDIENPVEGLLVYCTNCAPGGIGELCMFLDGKWRSITYNCHVPFFPAEGTHLPETDQITWQWNPVPIALGYKWNTENNFSTAIDLGPATTYTETGLSCWTDYSRYVWSYNDCGYGGANILSQATLPVPFAPAPTQGIHDISIPGTIIWNWNAVPGATGYKWNPVNDITTATDLGSSTSKTENGLTCNTLYTRYIWAYDECGFSTGTALSQTTSSELPDAPTQGLHVPWHQQIVWNWNTVSGATGYKWNNTNDYSTAIDMGTSVSRTETGLTCNTSYTRYVWAYNVCGEHSAPVSLTEGTIECCGTSISINHVAGVVAPETKTVTYGIVTDVPGEPLKCWISSNLGSNRQALAVDDASEASAGWYWQFNRKQGYMHDGITVTPDNTFIENFDEDLEWQAGNDPCNLELGSGWRLPTSTEWSNLDFNGNWTYAVDPWNSALKLHMAGYLIASGNPVNVYLNSRGAQGHYWSSSQNDSYTGNNLYFEGLEWFFGECTVSNNMKTYGYPIRCLKE